MENLIYSIKQDKDAVVVLFQGKFSAKEIPILEKMITELEGKKQRHIIFDFRRVSSCLTYAAFHKILKSYRGANKVVALTSLKPEIKMMMVREGGARESEIYGSIPEALGSVSAKP